MSNFLMDFIFNTFSWLVIGIIAGSLVLAGYIFGFLTAMKKVKTLTSSLEKDIIKTIKNKQSVVRMNQARNSQ